MTWRMLDGFRHSSFGLFTFDHEIEDLQKVDSCVGHSHSNTTTAEFFWDCVCAEKGQPMSLENFA